MAITANPSGTRLARGTPWALHLLTTRIVCYGVGIVSASLDIVNIVRGWRAEGTSLEDPSQKTG
jgi:hypothetical protein